MLTARLTNATREPPGDHAGADAGVAPKVSWGILMPSVRSTKSCGIPPPSGLGRLEDDPRAVR